MARWRNETRQPIPSPAEGVDVTYIGNDLFLNTKGYYKGCSATENRNNECYGAAEKMTPQVAAMTGVTTRFTKTASDGNDYTFNASPSCYTWWTGNNDPIYDAAAGLPEDYESLEDKLFAYAREQHAGGSSGGRANLSQPALSDEETEALVKQMLINSSDVGLGNVRNDVNEGAEGNLLSWSYEAIKQFVAGIGAALLLLILQATLQVLVPLLYMMQALAVMAFIVAMSITLILKRYSIGTAANAMVILIGLLILPLLWHIADILNSELIHMMIGNDNDPGYSLFTAVNDTLLNLIVLIFSFFSYIYLPKLFFGFISDLGLKMESNSTDFVNKISGEAGANTPTSKVDVMKAGKVGKF